MRICKDCNKEIEGMHALRCLACIKLNKHKRSKINKDKYQYHKQPKYKYANYKRGAIRRGFVFELTFDEFNLYWNKNCTYCGDNIPGIGLDRINNTIGYTIDNIASCCTTCNMMKHKLSHQEFINKCIKISKCFTDGPT